MRLFVALKTLLNDDAIFSVEKTLMRQIFDVKWVEKKNLHLTLKFLGETDEKRIYKINEIILNSVSLFKQFSFSYQGISAFPDKKNAKVIFIAVRNPEKIIRLMIALDKNLHESGFKLEKSYVPHLTLGRVRRKSVNLNRIGEIRFSDIVVKAVGVSLIKSVLSPDGPIYEEISSFGFA